jgi:hypothetical protein
MRTIKIKSKKIKKIKIKEKIYCRYCKHFIAWIDKNKMNEYDCDKETVKNLDFKGDLIKKYSDLKPDIKNVNNDCIDYKEVWIFRLLPFLRRK